MTSAVTTLAAEDARLPDARELDAERVVATMRLAAMWLAEMRKQTPRLATCTVVDVLYDIVMAIRQLKGIQHDRSN